MTAAEELSVDLSVVAACEALGVSRATLYRRRRPAVASEPTTPTRSHRALSQEEGHQVLDVLNSKRFRDLAPAEVYATLLDEGTYLCSPSSAAVATRNRPQLR